MATPSELADPPGAPQSLSPTEMKQGKKSKKSATCSKTLSPTWDEDLDLQTKLSLKSAIKNRLELE